MTLRRFLLQSHTLIGLSAGLILAVVGFTGGLLSFEQPIIKLASGNIMTVEVPDKAVPLSPETLLQRLRPQVDDRINSLTFSNKAADAVTVNLDSGGRRGTNVYANPYSGEITGEARGRDAMLQIMRIHRWLLLDIDKGRPIVGVATALLLILALTGLYLRRPKQLRHWRAWLPVIPGRKRGAMRQLHLATGTWVLLIYLLSAGTGLWWSFDWYRAGLYNLAQVEQPTRQPPASTNSPNDGPTVADDNISLNHTWSSFIGALGSNDYSSARISVPDSGDNRINVRYLLTDAPHERATNTMTFSAASGDLLAQQRYADKPKGERFISSIFPLHSGSFFGLPGIILMMIASFLMPLFFVTGLMLYLKRRRREKSPKRVSIEPAT